MLIGSSIRFSSMRRSLSSFRELNGKTCLPLYGSINLVIRSPWMFEKQKATFSILVIALDAVVNSWLLRFVKFENIFTFFAFFLSLYTLYLAECDLNRTIMFYNFLPFKIFTFPIRCCLSRLLSSSGLTISILIIFVTTFFTSSSLSFSGRNTFFINTFDRRWYWSRRSSSVINCPYRIPVPK